MKVTGGITGNYAEFALLDFLLRTSFFFTMGFLLLFLILNSSSGSSIHSSQERIYSDLLYKVVTLQLAYVAIVPIEYR